MKMITNSQTAPTINAILQGSAANATSPESASKRIEDWYQGNPIPVRAIDGHAHVFIRGLPLASVRRHAPDYDATLEMYVTQLQANNISHAVLVQPSFLGTDNSFIQDVLERYPRRFRGVATVDPFIQDAQLVGLDAAGFVGMRLNLVGLAIPDFHEPHWQALLSRVNTLGWHVEVHRKAADLPQILPALLKHGCRVVVDHFGRPDAAVGVKDPGFQYLLSLADTGQVWVKISAAYRTIAGEAWGLFGKQATMALLKSYTAQRLMWGSDWPHTQHRKIANYQATCLALNEWVDDVAVRTAIQAETPKELFRF